MPVSDRGRAPQAGRTGRQLRALLAASRASPGLTAGCAVILVMLVVPSVIALPHDPLRTNTGQVFAPPSAEFWLGTDGLGRDVFARLVAGARLDVPLALAGVAVSLLVGTPLGLLASTKGPWAERVMRGVDMFQAFPLLVLAIVIVALTGNRLENIVVAIALINVPRLIRLVRSEALTIRESRFVEAAIAIGASPIRVMVRHVLPHVTGMIFAQASLTAAQAIVVIAALSFLGIGVTPPTPSWGAMIQAGSQSMVTGHWWVSVFPGLAILVTVAAFNLIAEGLETALGGRAHA